MVIYGDSSDEIGIFFGESTIGIDGAKMGRCQIDGPWDEWWVLPRPK